MTYFDFTWHNTHIHIPTAYCLYVYEFPAYYLIYAMIWYYISETISICYIVFLSYISYIYTPPPLHYAIWNDYDYAIWNDYDYAMLYEMTMTDGFMKWLWLWLWANTQWPNTTHTNKHKHKPNRLSKKSLSPKHSKVLQISIYIFT